MTTNERETTNRDAAGVVRYTGYDPQTGDCHFAVDLSRWADGNLPPIPAARLMNSAPAMLEALKWAMGHVTVANLSMANKGAAIDDYLVGYELARAAITAAEREQIQ